MHTRRPKAPRKTPGADISLPSLAIEIAPVRPGADGRARSAAARSAARRALLRALGLPRSRRLAGAIEIRSPVPWGSGPPRLVISGEVARRARALRIAPPLLSLSHTEGIAVALVVVEPLETGRGRGKGRGAERGADQSRGEAGKLRP